jgi:spermidine synthase
MADPRLQVVNRDAAAFLKDNPDFFDVILIDLPDPDTVDLAHLYSESFYHLVRRHLRPGGVVVTQAASPYFAPKAFLSILKTMTTAGLTVLPYHNQIPTMGEWGWALGVRDSEARPDQIKARALTLDFNGIPTRFLNAEAMVSMVHFGKGVFFPGWENEIEVNTQARPILPTYYRSGAWNLD